MRALAGVSRVVLAGATLLVAQSVWWSPGASLSFSLLVCSLFALALWRPGWALLALAFLAPFGRVIAVGWFSGYPIRGAEAMALGVLAGVAVRGTWRPLTPAPLPARAAGPWVLFAVAVLASAAVVYRVSQFYLDYAGAFFWRFVNSLVFDYHGLPGDPRPWLEPVDFRYVATALLVVEGVALLLVAARLSAATPGYARRLLALTVAAGAAASLLSINAVAEAALATATPVQSLAAIVANQRWSVHVSKVNTAGSYFVMAGALAVGMGLVDRRRRFWWLGAAAVIVVGLWLTASLAAILSGAAVAVAAAIWWLSLSGARGRRHAIIASVLLAMVVTAVVVRMSTRTDAADSFGRRWAIAQVSIATAAEAPVFGVGIGRYALRAQPHVTDAVRAGFGEGSLEPHNYALQIAAELGLVGLVLYLWGLVVSFRQIVVGRTATGHRCATPAAAAVAAFLLSALSGQPMLVDAVAIPLWLTLGVLVGHFETSPRSGPMPAWLVAGAVAIVATIPFRMAGAVQEADPRLAAHGTTPIEFVENGRGRFVHRIDGPARLFIPKSAVAVAFDTRAESDQDVFLSVSGDGLSVSPIRLPPGVVRNVCVPVAPDAVRARGLRAVDVEVRTSSGAPAPPGTAWAVAFGLDEGCGR